MWIEELREEVLDDHMCVRVRRLVLSSPLQWKTLDKRDYIYVAVSAVLFDGLRPLLLYKLDEAQEPSSFSTDMR